MRRTPAIKLVKGLATVVPPKPTVDRITPGHPLYDHLRDVRERAERRTAENRRTRLHFFGLAGGRRGQ